MKNKKVTKLSERDEIMSSFDTKNRALIEAIQADRTYKMPAGYIS